MNTCHRLAAAAAVLALNLTALRAEVPRIINYQGRVAVGAVNFDGAGQFKFALINGDGDNGWSNDGTSISGSQPAAAVAVAVSKGLYSVMLGDTAITNMTAIPADLFNDSVVRLRVWFNDGTHGFQLLTPDQRIAAVGYALIAAGVEDEAITNDMIAHGAVRAEQLSGGAVESVHIAAGAIKSDHLANDLQFNGLTLASVGIVLPTTMGIRTISANLNGVDIDGISFSVIVSPGINVNPAPNIVNGFEFIAVGPR